MSEEIYTKKLFLENEVKGGFGFIQLDDDTLYFMDENSNTIAYFSRQSGFAFTNSDSNFKLHQIGLATFTDDVVIAWRNKSGSPLLVSEKGDLEHKTTSELLAIENPQIGKQYFNLDNNCICYFNGSDWKKITAENL